MRIKKRSEQMKFKIGDQGSRPIWDLENQPALPDPVLIL
jgi:hypothetical protein